MSSFELLSPDAALGAAERAYAISLDGTVDAYPSYVNRVYGLRSEDGARYVAKFYRPGRWTREAILDEHRFLLDCAEAEIPVIPPLAGANGETLHTVRVPDGDGGQPEQTFLFTLFPRSGGRAFEPESDEDLVRLGSILGRCHAVGAQREAAGRVVLGPELTRSFVTELLEGDLVHPECRDDFSGICADTLEAISPLFEGMARVRIHGDCHRANILVRPETGLVLIDFDDMMSGPAVQDLWLVLPGYASDSHREIELLLEGYERFAPFDRGTLALIEPLRFMRMIYFLAWRARQRADYWFQQSFPDWGTEAFWITETEDLRVQANVIRGERED